MNLNKDISTPIAILLIVAIATAAAVAVWQFRSTEGPVPKQASDYTTQTACQKAGYYWYNGTCHKEQSDIANWKTYTNEKYSFKFKYPVEEYNLSEQQFSNKRFEVQLTRAGRKSKMSRVPKVIIREDKTVNQLIQDISSNSILKQEEILVDGTEGISLTMETIKAYPSNKLVFVGKDSLVYELVHLPDSVFSTFEFAD